METEPAAPENSVATEWSLRGLFEVLFRHQTKGLVVFLVVFGAVAVWAFVAPQVYRSEAKLLIQVGRESVTLDPTAAIGERTLDPRTTWENEVNSELEILKNAELRRGVVLEVGAAVLLGRGPGSGAPSAGPGLFARWKKRLRALLPASTQALTEEDRAEILLESKLDIRSVPESSVLKIGYEAGTADLAQHVVSTFTARYLDKHREVHRTQGSLEYFSAEVARLEQSLAEAEEGLRDLKNAALVGSVEEKRAALAARSGSLEQQALVAQAGARAAEAKVAALEAAMNDHGLGDSVLIQETTTMRSPSTEALVQQLDALRLEQQSLLENFEPGSRAVRAVEAKVELAETMLAEASAGVTERVEGPNPAHSQILVALMTERATAASLRAQAEAFRGDLEALQGELETLNRVELEIKRAEREIADLESRTRRQRSNLEQVRTDHALESLGITNIAVLQPASRPLKSSRMGRSTALLMGLILGLVGAISAVYLAEFTDGSLRTPDDVRRRLGLAPLASIPRRASLRRWYGVAVAPTEEVSALRDQVLGGGSTVRTVLGVTSAHRGEGVSTVAANLAAVLARRGEGRVLLVDAVLNSPALHRAFQVARAPGLAERLFQGDTESAQPTEVPNLLVLTAGDLRKGPVKGLGRQAAAEQAFDRLTLDFVGLAREWRATFQHVIVDLPPVGRISGVARVAAHCDGVLLVTAAGRHRWQIAQHALERLRRFDVPVLGSVLNKRQYPIPGWLYRAL